MIRIFLIVIFFYFSYSQTIPYQAILRDNSGNILPNVQVTLTVNYFNNITSNTPDFGEMFTETTNSWGLISIKLGSGTPLQGNFSSVTWNNGQVAFEISVITSTGAFQIPKQNFQYVPYAFYAKEIDPQFSSKWDYILTTNALVPNNTYSNSNVGIGLTNPDTKLTVAASNTSVIKAINNNNSGGLTTVYEGYNINGSPFSAVYFGANNQGYGAYFITNSTSNSVSAVTGTAGNGAHAILGISQSTLGAGVVGLNRNINNTSDTSIISLGVMGVSNAGAKYSAGVFGLNKKSGCGVIGVIDTSSGNAGVLAMAVKHATTQNVTALKSLATGSATSFHAISTGTGLAILASKTGSNTSGPVVVVESTPQNTASPLISVSQNSAAPSMVAHAAGQAHVSLELANGHIKTTSVQSPTLSCNCSAQITYSLVPGSTDVAGSIYFTISGTTPDFDIQLNFTKNYISKPVVIVNISSNNNSLGNFPRFYLIQQNSPPFNNFGVRIESNLLNNGIPYYINYFVIEKN